MTIQSWLSDNGMKYEFTSDNIFTIPNVGKFLAVRDKEKTLTESLDIILDEDEEGVEVDFYAYQFGQSWYYSKSYEISNFTILKYLGEYDSILGVTYPFLGVHGGFDLLNGSRSYGDWVKKAKFLGVDTLGICEKNTLGGVLKFQIKCKDGKIKPIIGMQVCVKMKDDTTYIKCYAKDERGWDSLLRINKEINVVNGGHIDKQTLLKNTDGLIVVVDPKFTSVKESLPYQLSVCKGDLYWQLDTVEFENDGKDKEYLLNVAEYIKNREIPPILITDAYYLDREDFEAKIMLNTIADRREHASKNQFFKSPDDVFSELMDLFNNEDDLYSVFELSVENAMLVTDRCNFTIKVDQWLLPEYIMTEKEVEVYGNKMTMFNYLIDKGLNSKTPKGKESEYRARMNMEVEIIIKYNFVDYFLILWDIVRFCHESDILIGISIAFHPFGNSSENPK